MLKNCITKMNMKKAIIKKSGIFYNFIFSNDSFYIKNLDRYIKAIEWDNEFILHKISKFCR